MDMFDHLLADRKKDFMKILKKEELKVINGGGISASLLTAAVRAVTSLLELGRSLGTAIRRISSGSVCSL